VTGAQQVWLAYDFQAHLWLADWIAAIGQALGAAFTFGAVWVALRAGRRAERLRDEDQADRDSAQARMVTVQLSRAPYRASTPASEFLPDQEHLVVIRNDGSEPISRAELFRVRAARDPDDGRDRWQLVPIPNNEQIRQVIGPGCTADFRVLYVPRPGQIQWPDGDVSVTIDFRDSRGLWWGRDNDDPPMRIMSSAADVEEIVREFRRRNPWWKPGREKPYLSWRERELVPRLLKACRWIDRRFPELRQGCAWIDRRFPELRQGCAWIDRKVPWLRRTGGRVGTRLLFGRRPPTLTSAVERPLRDVPPRAGPPA
jgi:hypothetical protein